MIGFASDETAIMMGIHHSVSTECKKIIPNLFVMKCICHSMDIAASNAAKKLHAYLEEVLLEIFYYLKYSTKRQVALGELQKLLNIPEHKFLQLHKVRWLSLNSVVNRTLEQYDTLLTFFENETKNGSNKEKAKKIHN